jgi:hypothetical protein
MVERYSHMAPDHLRAAVERLVPVRSQPMPAPADAVPAVVELDRNLTVRQDGASRVL